MMYNPYYNSQISLDKIDNQIKELENMRSQLQRPQQPSINQTFQLAPSTNQVGVRTAENIDEVKKELVFGDTVFINKAYSSLWFKNVQGEVKTYAMTEVVEKDEKDLVIENLQKQIDELKGMMTNEQYDSSNVIRETTNDKSSRVQTGPADDAK